jgi:hypothetical protein
MAEKKEKKDKRNLLLQHPEIKNNAKALFRCENGKTIVEEIVPRGDIKTKDLIYPRNQGDLKNEDLRGLAVHASSLIDPLISKYDINLAREDALHMAIRTKDGGKYDGKVNASTFSTIMNFMGSMKKAADATEAANYNPAVVEVEVGTNKERIIEKQSSIPESIPEEVTQMTKQDLIKIKESLLAKVAAIDVLVGGEGMAKDAAETKKCPKCGTKVLVKTGYCVKCKEKTLGKKDDDDKEDKKEDKEDKKEDKKDEKEDKEDKKEDKDDEKDDEKDEKKEKDSAEVPEQIATITSALDKVAGELEGMNDPELFKIAYQLDQMSDILEGKKEARTLETEPSREYMSKFFKGGLREGDADEKGYMTEFNTDLTTEVEGVKDKKDGNVKRASEKLPYKIVK